MKKEASFYHRTVELLRKMYRPNCGVKLRSKAESLQILKERYQQYRLDEETESQEARTLRKTIEAAQNS